MSAVTPNTNLKLLKLDNELDERNQLTFSSKEAQTNYFLSLTGLFADYFTYQRKDGIIRFPAHIDTLLDYNYVMYQNENYGNKYFYAFISEMTYINDSMTEIKIKTDVFQTWQFDFEFKKSFVEREIVSDDTIGKHTIPENLQYGEYIEAGVERFPTNDVMYLIQTLKFYHNLAEPIATNVGRMPMAGGFYLCDTFQEVVDILVGYANANVSQDNIQSIYMIPKEIISDRTVDSNLVWQGSDIVNGNLTINKLSSIDGYTPKNNKLLCYPYTGIVLSNNSGSSNILRFEDFETNNCQFEVKGMPTIGGSIKVSPRYYKKHGSGGYEEEGIIAGKFPTLSWSKDAYSNWLSQNALNVGLGVVTGVAETLINPISGLTTLGTTLKQVTEANFVPNSTKGNINSGDIDTVTATNTPTIYSMTIKSEYAKIIDEFFSMYGYLVNECKIPNLNSRSNWNYIKTQNVNIIGDIPSKDLNELKQMFNDGLTLWHNALTFLDYSQTNSII